MSAPPISFRAGLEPPSSCRCRSGPLGSSSNYRSTWGARGTSPAWSTRTRSRYRAHRPTGSTRQRFRLGCRGTWRAHSRQPMQGKPGPSPVRRSPCRASPFSFTSPDTGFVQGVGLVIALRTSDRGVTWNPESAPISRSVQASWSLGYVVSAVQIVGPHLAVTAGATGLMTSSDVAAPGSTGWEFTSPVGRDRLHQHTSCFTVDNGELLRTIDGGARWHGLLHPVAGGVSGIDFLVAKPRPGRRRPEPFRHVRRGRDLAAASASPGWKVPGAFVAGTSRFPVCFTRQGYRMGRCHPDHRYGVLVSTTGGRSWRLALPSDVLPLEPNPTNSEATFRSPGAMARRLDSRLAGCRADGNARAYLSPSTCCAALTSCRSWLDVLRSTERGTSGPAEGPPLPRAGHSRCRSNWVSGALALVSPATAWFTATNEDLGSITLGSTRDGGLHWTIRSSPGAQDQQGPVASSRQLPYAYRWLARRPSR